MHLFERGNDVGKNLSCYLPDLTDVIAVAGLLDL